LSREEGIQGVDGWQAVLLWQRACRGDRHALDTLVRYCAEDVVGLEPLAELAYNGLTGLLPLSIEPLPPTARRVLDWAYTV
jgi:uncharacterized protein YprB with RNaseH-like and TPR domain